jgi:hypothetical protein
MSNYDNTNTGRIFKNERMRPDKKDPEYKGDANIEGKEFWVSAWVNETQDGKKYFRTKYTAKQVVPIEKATKEIKTHVEKTHTEEGEEIPF